MSFVPGRNLFYGTLLSVFLAWLLVLPLLALYLFLLRSMVRLSRSLTDTGYAITAAAGGILAIVSGFDIGGLAAYLNYCRQITQPVNQISMQMTTVLAALAGAGIEIVLITTSDLDISLLIRQQDEDTALDALHKAFAV